MATRVEKKSKRTTTRHRAKVERKVREHRRKLNKASKGASHHKKSRKDPGLPGAYPHKDEFLQQLQAERDKEKRQRQLAIAKNDLSGLASEASSRSEKYQLQEQQASSAGPQEEVPKFYDTSKRAFYHEFRQVVGCSDVILVVLDARDPEGCRVKVVEELVAASGGQKRLVLVLNKIDLVPRPVVTQWLAHLRRELPAVAFKSSTQGNAASGAASAMSSGECLGADMLIQLLKNYCRNLNIKTSIRVGVVGYPNVGKSSLINSLKRSKVCKVGATPGVTTASQEIHLDKNIKLLDCPGIVFASPSDTDELAHLFLRNCVRVEQLEDPIAPVELILQRATPEQLMMLYTIPRFEGTQQFLIQVAKHQGKLKKGGIPNLEAAAKSVLADWNQGKIPFYTLPPAVAQTGAAVSSAEVVAEWAPVFDLDSVTTVEQQILEDAPEVISDARPMDLGAKGGLLPQLVVAERAPRPGNPSRPLATTQDAYHVQLSEMEQNLNPQINQNRAKALKQARKTARKRTEASLAEHPSEAADMDIDG